MITGSVLTSPAAGAMKTWRQLFTSILLALAALCAVTPALADYCGRLGERPCLVTEFFPSCATNLVQAGTACIHPDCGAEGQSSCALAQRPLGASCDIDLVGPLNLVGTSAVACAHPKGCGHVGERACTIFERIPSCDHDLVEGAGKCNRPACGMEGSRPCTLSERPVLSFFAGLVLPEGVALSQFTAMTSTGCDLDLVARTIGQSAVNVATGGVSGNLNQSGAAPLGTILCHRPGSLPPLAAASASAGSGAAAAPHGALAVGVEVATDRPGSDYKSAILASADPNLCLTLCNGDTQCRAWTYTNPGVKAPSAVCFLKSTAPAPVADACCYSGLGKPAAPLQIPAAAAGSLGGPRSPGTAPVPPLPTVPGTGTAGGQSGGTAATGTTGTQTGPTGSTGATSTQGSGTGSAGSAGTQTSGTGTTVSGGTQTAAAGGTGTTATAAGGTTASGLEPNSTLIGGDYLTLELSSPDPLLCQSICSAEINCIAFTYTKPGIKGTNAFCALKRGAPTPAHDSCCISGLRPNGPANAVAGQPGAGQITAAAATTHDSVTVGQTKTYSAAVTPGTQYVATMIPIAGGADFAVFSDSALTQAVRCMPQSVTYDSSKIKDCSFVATTATVYGSVTGHNLNVTGESVISFIFRVLPRNTAAAALQGTQANPQVLTPNVAFAGTSGPGWSNYSFYKVDAPAGKDVLISITGKIDGEGIGIHVYDNPNYANYLTSTAYDCWIREDGAAPAGCAFAGGKTYYIDAYTEGDGRGGPFTLMAEDVPAGTATP